MSVTIDWWYGYLDSAFSAFVFMYHVFFKGYTSFKLLVLVAVQYFVAINFFGFEVKLLLVQQVNSELVVNFENC